MIVKVREMAMEFFIIRFGIFLFCGVLASSRWLACWTYQTIVTPELAELPFVRHSVGAPVVLGVRHSANRRHVATAGHATGGQPGYVYRILQASMAPRRSAVALIWYVPLACEWRAGVNGPKPYGCSAVLALLFHFLSVLNGKLQWQKNVKFCSIFLFAIYLGKINKSDHLPKKFVFTLAIDSKLCGFSSANICNLIFFKWRSFSLLSLSDCSIVSNSQLKRTRACSERSPAVQRAFNPIARRFPWTTSTRGRTISYRKPSSKATRAMCALKSKSSHFTCSIMASTCSIMSVL